MNNTFRYILGIDISKKHFDVALLLPGGKRKNKKFSNHQEGFDALQVWLDHYSIDQLHACLEATNVYGHAIAEFLFDQGYDVSIVNPVRIKGFAQSELLRTKTDKQDASLIARFCQAMSPGLWEPEPRQVRELKAMVKRLDVLIDMKQQEANRLEVADQVISESIEQHLKLLTEQIDTLRKIIQDHIDHDPNLRQQKELLLSIPGIGEKTVATLLSYFSTVERFDNAKKLAAFCGVSPSAFESGTSINKHRRMSKKGSAHLRKALFFPAMVALRFNPLLQDLQKRMLKTGKPKMVIIGAAMRKLVHIIYGVLSKKAPFNSEIGQKKLAY